MKGFEKACVAVATVVILFSSGAAGQIFGTKVGPGDWDLNRPLDDFSKCQIPIYLGYWDIGPNPGIPDEGDIVYLHISATAGTGAPPFSIHANDIRLTPWEDKPAGSKVKSSDNDMGQPLVIPKKAGIYYMNLFGSTPGYDLEDPVYVLLRGPVPLPLTTMTNDLRICHIKIKDVLLAGEKVRDFDEDHFKPLVLPPLLVQGPGGLAANLANLRFYNANGNYRPIPALVPTYDDPDDVYIDMVNVPPIPAPFNLRGIVTVNDLRLTEPAV